MATVFWVWSQTVFAGNNRTARVKAEELYPLTFSKLLVRLNDSVDIWRLGENFELTILEHLRAWGYPAVGGENILFNVEKSDKARMVLGGTVTEFGCVVDYLAEQQACDMALRFELFDIEKEAVIYKVLTRARIYIPRRARFTAENGGDLVLRALDSLLKRPRFNEALTRKARENDAAPHPTGTFKACAAKNLSLPKDMSAVLEASVSIRLGELLMGSGFFISDDGLIVTAAHVVEDESTVTIETRSGLQLKASVLLRNSERDSAVLRVDGAGFPCLSLAEDLPAEGSDLYMIGSPAPVGKELALSVSKGVASGIRTIDGVTYLQTDAASNPGNSGGALVDTSGNAVGIISKKVFGAEGLAFATPARSGVEAAGLVPASVTSVSQQPMVPEAEERLVADASDAVPADPREHFEIYAAEVRPIHRRQTGGIALTILGSMGVVGGLVLIAVDTDKQRAIIGASVAGTGLVALIGGSLLFVSAKKQENALKQKMTDPILALTPLSNRSGAAASLTWRF